MAKTAIKDEKDQNGHVWRASVVTRNGIALQCARCDRKWKVGDRIPTEQCEGK